MATIGLMSQHPGSFASHKHYYVQQQQQPHSPPQQHYTAPPPPQQSQPPHSHMQPQPHPHQPPPHYYHSAPASSFASSPSTSSYSHPNTSTAAYFMPTNKPYDRSGQHQHPPQPPPAHYYNQQPMQPMAVQPANNTSPGPSSHQLPQTSAPSSSTSSSSAAPSSSPALSHMVQVNGSQYVLSPVQPNTTPYPVMLIPLAANNQHIDNTATSAHRHPTSTTSSTSISVSSMSDDERKARHIKTPQQMRSLKSAYTVNPKPGKEEMKSLMKETKCSYNEVCRWFRNERHKEKKIKDGRVALDAKATPATSTAYTDSATSGSDSAVDSKSAGVMSDSRPQSPTGSSSTPSTPASSQPSSPLSTGASAADGDRRLSAWLQVFTAEFTCEQQQAALRQLIERTRTLAESGNELEDVLNRKRGRDSDDGVKAEAAVEAAAETEDEEDSDESKRRRVE